MTNKEAIAILTHNWKYRELIDNPYQYEALDLAIKALEERPTVEYPDVKEIIDVIHKTIYQFFDVYADDEETPISDKDKLLLEVNKAICNKLKVRLFNYGNR